MKKHLLLFVATAFGLTLQAQKKFAQLDQELPTPNEYRTASGAPGHHYYQQKADYVMKLSIDDATQKLYGWESITYTNNSPDQLDYLWLQLDQNVFSVNSVSKLIEVEKMEDFKLNKLMTVIFYYYYKSNARLLSKS